MLDYKGIEALHTIIEQQSFEAAAKALFVTQPAITQRIKNIEHFYGEPILVRTLPYKPTKLGQFLIQCYKQVTVLEEELEQKMTLKNARPRVAIAISRDSLETWFLQLINEQNIFDGALFEIIADDQDRTLAYLQNGQVNMCISTASTALPSCNVAFLGNLEYLLVASPQFIQKYFTAKNKTPALLNAPALKFDSNDYLHDRYLEKYFNIYEPPKNYQIVPSVQGFKQFALKHKAYGLIPKIDILKELESKQLIPIFHNKTFEVPLNLHYWQLQPKLNQDLTDTIIKETHKYFKLCS